ncbi:MAG: transketolase [Bacilli bacterium]|nr:transketolase [Bacilli bacterium]
MERETINNIKTLGIDMINEAKSGHSGIVLGAAPIIYTLYANHMNINTSDSNWVNRDRFVMSAGHGSALLYATLYMAGYDLSIDDLKRFRRIGSKTPGHPEVGITPGVDMSTGPLGQGIASAVGMAIAEKMLEEKYKFPKEKAFKNKKLIEYRIYALCGDGDLMEGISYEAASLAGTLNLDNLMILYDSNNITLDGKTDTTFKESILDRFKAMGWYTDTVKNGLVVNDINKAITKAKESGKPSIIEIKTIIGVGSALAGTNEVHGKPLEKEDMEQLKTSLGISNLPFYVNESARTDFRGKISSRSNKKYEEWVNNYREYVNKVLDGDASKLNILFGKEKPADLNGIDFDLKPKEATRASNGRIMNKFIKEAPTLVGGSADLSSSTKTYLNDLGDFSITNRTGRNIFFGVREHAMGAILNGMALSGFRPFGSTFLVFSDYLKPAIRMSALMNLPVTYIFTHDAVNVGQDGPTHEPIEQLAMLRSIPNHDVFRPADGTEIIGSWAYILNSRHPNSLILSRVDVDNLKETNPNGVLYGGYILRKEQNSLHGIIIATGSEVMTALKISDELFKEYGLDLRVVSMPCRELFLRQDKQYKDSVLPSGVRTVVIEAGSKFGWEGFVYNNNYLITINHFGASGTKDEVLEFCKFDYEKIKNRVISLFR